MNFRSSAHASHDFQIAPLIDVVFLLLVFFIATASMAELERELGVALPPAEHADPAESRLHEIVVNLGADGAITVNRQRLKLEELRARLLRLARLAPGGPGPSVILRADEACQHRYVLAILDLCRDPEARVGQICFGARTPPASSHAAP